MKFSDLADVVFLGIDYNEITKVSDDEANSLKAVERVRQLIVANVAQSLRNAAAAVERDMARNVAIGVFIFMVLQATVYAPPPMRLTIDCGRKTKDSQRPLLGSSIGYRPKYRYNSEETFDVESFCKLIHTAIPKAVKDGKFVLIDPYDDQDSFADTQIPVIVSPPKGLNGNNFRVPKLRIPRINVPRLNSFSGPVAPPIGKAMSFPVFRDDESQELDSSAERMEKFKKGIQKMLHVVKVLGQVDKYLTERTRIIIDKLSKTLAE